MSVMNMNNPGEPPMFVRVMLQGTYYDLAIADISAIEVPMTAQQTHVHLIIGGLHALMGRPAYETIHAAWVARRRSAAGR